jgi:hypothetical protein
MPIKKSWSVVFISIIAVVACIPQLQMLCLRINSWFLMNGLKTLELVEAHIRNMLGIVPEEPKPELENKEGKRSVGGRQRVEDIVQTFQFEEDSAGEGEFMTKEPPKFKILASHFEQG